MKLRAAHPLDAAAVGDILWAFLEDTDWMPSLYTAAETIGFAGTMIDNGWVQVAEDAGSVQGFIARNDTFVHALYVARSARGTGVGSMLLDAAQSEVGCLNLWTFQANMPARRFYAAHGFRETQRTDGARNEERLPDIEMVWNRRAV